MCQFNVEENAGHFQRKLNGDSEPAYGKRNQVPNCIVYRKNRTLKP